MLALALANDEHYPDAAERERLLHELSAGLLHQQRRDGTYRVHFGQQAPGDSGWQLYAGEAMLALMAAYRALGDERLLRSVRHALPRYEKMYRREGQGGGSVGWGAALRYGLVCAVLGEVASSVGLVEFPPGGSSSQDSF